MYEVKLLVAKALRGVVVSLAVLERGRIAEQGRLSDIAADPQTVLAKALTEQL